MCHSHHRQGCLCGQIHFHFGSTLTMTIITIITIKTILNLVQIFPLIELLVFYQRLVLVCICLADACCVPAGTDQLSSGLAGSLISTSTQVSPTTHCVARIVTFQAATYQQWSHPIVL